MHLHSLLQPQLDPPNVAQVQRIAFDREKAGLVALAQATDPPLPEDRPRRAFGPELDGPSWHRGHASRAVHCSDVRSSSSSLGTMAEYMRIS
jgi:hypothetical protein